MSITWPIILDAMHAAIIAASKLPDGQVIWKGQNVGAPEESYVAMSLGPVLEVGQDGEVDKTDLSRPAGEEVELEMLGSREVALQLEVFTAATVPTVGAEDALTIAERVRTRLRLSSIRRPLAEATVSPFGIGQVQHLPAIEAAGFRGRALLDVRCYLSVPLDDAKEYTGYIARVNGTVTASGDGSGTVTKNFTAP